MSGLIEIAERVMARSEQRLETVSRNISNASTPGYKSEVSFPVVAGLAADKPGLPGEQGPGSAQLGGGLVSHRSDFSQGVLSETGRPLDLAIAGSGFFKVKAGGVDYLTRQGQFELSPDGRVRTMGGLILQDASGGDLILSSDAVEILTDGTILEAGRPVARIDLYTVDAPDALNSVGGSLFSFSEGREIVASDAVLHQGVIEGANVSMAEQMLEMSSAVRQAETGARLVQVYDGLLGQAISTFGQKR